MRETYRVCIPAGKSVPTSGIKFHRWQSWCLNSSSSTWRKSMLQLSIRRTSRGVAIPGFWDRRSIDSNSCDRQDQICWWWSRWILVMERIAERRTYNFLHDRRDRCAIAWASMYRPICWKRFPCPRYQEECKSHNYGCRVDSAKYKSRSAVEWCTTRRIRQILLLNSYFQSPNLLPYIRMGGAPTDHVTFICV